MSEQEKVLGETATACPTCGAQPVRVAYDSSGHRYYFHEHVDEPEPKVLAEGWMVNRICQKRIPGWQRREGQLHIHLDRAPAGSVPVAIIEREEP